MARLYHIDDLDSTFWERLEELEKRVEELEQSRDCTQVQLAELQQHHKEQ